MSQDPQSEYYDIGGLETVDILKAKLTPEQYRGFLMGNALKYLCRANWKHPEPLRDLDKCGMYITLLRKTF